MAKNKEFVYVALGGAGEIGMNMYLYGYGEPNNRRWIIVDCGVTFGDMSSCPGVDLVFPDLEFIAEQRKNIDAIIITHAHEDHVGAIGRLWRRLRAPIYCTKFTGQMVKRKLEENGLPEKHISLVEPRVNFKVGAFDLEFFPVTHSIPDAQALIIRTDLGTLFHSGDFKFDPEPLIGSPMDLDALEALGNEGIDFLTCDSTNVFEEGEAGSEADVRPGLIEAMREATGAVAATSFASNVARIRSLAEAARDCDRSVVVVGRSMHRMIEAAVETGIIQDFPQVISEDEAANLPAEHLFYLVTGSQGENRAALSRIAFGTHPSVKLGEGDLVLYSSRTIPGNEREVFRIYNKLSERGVQILDADLADIHVSGHAYRGELAQLYELLKPAYAIPIHGEHRHLTEHARMASEWGAEEAFVAPNGTLMRLAEENTEAAPEIIGQVETGRVYLDGDTMVGALDGVMRARLRMARQGHVAISLVVDEEGELIADPVVQAMGLPKDGEGWPAPLPELIAESVGEAIDKLKTRDRSSDQRLEEVASVACRRICDRYWRKKPETTVLVTRLEEEDD